MLIREAKEKQDFLSCFSVIKKLRPNLHQSAFYKQISVQSKQGYRIIYIQDKKKVVAMAGFRSMQNLAWGKFIYIDDLITLDKYRSKGYGQKLFEWILKHAIKNEFDQLHLDSGVIRYGAHRFYLRNKMIISSHHFALDLKK